MAQSHVAVMEAEDERLDVVRGARAGRCVTHVADGAIALQSFDFALIAEHLGEQAESAMTDEMTVIVGDDAGTFLTAMLQRVQPTSQSSFFKQGINYLPTLPIGGYIACCGVVGAWGCPWSCPWPHEQSRQVGPCSPMAPEYGLLLKSCCLIVRCFVFSTEMKDSFLPGWGHC